jgi:hypothetical protein
MAAGVVGAMGAWATAVVTVAQVSKATPRWVKFRGFKVGVLCFIECSDTTNPKNVQFLQKKAPCPATRRRAIDHGSAELADARPEASNLA